MHHIRKYCKDIVNHIGVCAMVYATNSLLFYFLDAFWVQFIWGLLCFWIFSDSVVVLHDMKVIKSKYEMMLSIYNKETSYQADTNRSILQNQRKKYEMLKEISRNSDKNHEVIMNKCDMLIAMLEKKQSVKEKSKGTKQDILVPQSLFSYTKTVEQKHGFVKQSSFNDLIIYPPP